MEMTTLIASVGLTILALFLSHRFFPDNSIPKARQVRYVLSFICCFFLFSSVANFKIAEQSREAAMLRGSLDRSIR